MQTVQFNLDELLLVELDQAARALATTREGFIQLALLRALRQQRAIRLERQHIQGYIRQPQTDEEVSEWLPAQEWGDA